MEGESRERGYKDGCKNGYNWLNRGPNFRHPSQSGGYIPGGPSNLHYRIDPVTREPNPKWTAQEEYRKAWIAGWVDGINAHVSDRGLNFPIVVLYNEER